MFVLTMAPASSSQLPAVLLEKPKYFGNLHALILGRASDISATPVRITTWRLSGRRPRSGGRSVAAAI